MTPLAFYAFMLGIETKVFYDLSMNEQTSVTTICRNKLLCIRLSPGDCEMDRCNGHSEEAWSAPRDGQGLHKVQGVFFNWAYPLDWATQKMLRLAPPLNFLSVGITFTSTDT